MRDQWMNEHGNTYEEGMEHVLWTIADKRDNEQDYEMDETFCKPDQDKGVQMC